jgi:hypothetical protein
MLHPPFYLYVFEFNFPVLLIFTCQPFHIPLKFEYYSLLLDGRFVVIVTNVYDSCPLIVFVSYCQHADFASLLQRDLLHHNRWL